MGDFIESQGLSFFAHLLRRVSDQLVEGFSKWNDEVGLRAPPRTHSTVQALFERKQLTVTELATLLRQSHPLVITWIRQLQDLGLVNSRSDPGDKRRTILQLTKAGRAEAQRQRKARAVTERALRELMEETNADIFKEMWRIERACRQTPFIDRLRAAEQPVVRERGKNISARSADIRNAD